ncbi:MAG: TonB-dependent receptor, partial [Sphingobacteriales bacterium]
MRIFIVSIFLCLHIWQPAKAANFTISGYVYDDASGEALLGAVVFDRAINKGTSSNEYGFYSFTLPEGSHEIQISYIGYQKQSISINLNQNIQKNIRLKMADQQLKEVIITAHGNEEKAAVKSTQMSSIKIQIEQIKHLPSLGGEVDIIKVMQLMPGVKRGGEGQTGMYVRGGGADQNLILLDEATVYNVSHLFGFFSVFNNDALKDVTMLKGGFPSQYGGRISSIMDIRMKEGNQQKYSAEGGVGLLSSRLTLQGPVLKDKASFLISGRRTYIDKVLGLVGLPIPYYFYDLNGKFNYTINNKDRIFYSAYFGNDVLHEPDMQDSTGENSDSSALDFGFKLGNFTNTLRWNHIYNPKLFSDKEAY